MNSLSLKSSCYRAAVCLLACLWLPATGQAQKLLRLVRYADSLLNERYQNPDIDTLYITRPKTKWTFAARINVSGATLETRGVDNGLPFRSEMNADYKSTVSLGVNYLGMALSLSLNPGKLLGRYHDYEVGLNSYRNRWGFDFFYQDASNFTGWYEGNGMPRIELPPEVLSMKSFNVNAYYAFNYRRFSYPAAFSQSFVQQQSAGSLLLGFSLQGQRSRTEGNYESLLKVFNVGLGAGYGYNWVPHRRWLFHLSALPTLTVYSNTSLSVDDDRISLDYHFPEVIITVRGAIIRQFGNMFAGATMVYNFTNVGDHNKLSVYHSKWHLRLLFGYRL